MIDSISEKEQLSLFHIIRNVYSIVITNKIFDLLVDMSLLENNEAVKNYFDKSILLYDKENLTNYSVIQPYINFKCDVSLITEFTKKMSGQKNILHLTTYLIEVLSHLFKPFDLNIACNIQFYYGPQFITNYLFGENKIYRIKKNTLSETLLLEDMVCIKNLYHMIFDSGILYNNGQRQVGSTTCNIYKTILQKIMTEKYEVEFPVQHKVYEQRQFNLILKESGLFKLSEHYTLKDTNNYNSFNNQHRLSLVNYDSYISGMEREKILKSLFTAINKNYFLI